MYNVGELGRSVGLFGLAKSGLLVVAVVVAATASAQSAAPTIVEVHAGDTFAGIAARYTGSPATWRRAYKAQLSNLPNPSAISVGMRFELVSAADGSQYLRLLPSRTGQAGAALRQMPAQPMPVASTAVSSPAPTPASA